MSELPLKRLGPATFLACLLLGVNGGCRTAPHMAPANFEQAGWTVRRGQAVWQPKADAPELAGHLLIASHASGEDFIRFSKEPLELVLARRNHTGWLLDIPAFHKSYSYRGQPPRRIGWFQLADAVFRDSATGEWEWSGEHDGGWSLINQRTGERLEGFFTQ